MPQVVLKHALLDGNLRAFVEVLRKRGFVLKEGEGAVDLSNRMFVKMAFVKGVSPAKGKNVKEQLPKKEAAPLAARARDMG